MNTLTEQQILEAENNYWVDMWASLERLKANKDFQRVILNGFFKDKAINGVSLLAQDGIIDAGKRPAVIESLIAISHLEDFFITVENFGNVNIDEDNDEDEDE